MTQERIAWGWPMSIIQEQYDAAIAHRRADDAHAFSRARDAYEFIGPLEVEGDDRNGDCWQCERYLPDYARRNALTPGGVCGPCARRVKR